VSHRATNWAFDQRGLPPVQSLVLIRLADHHNVLHGCFPSQKLLAEEVNVSQSTLNEHLRALEERGLIRRVRRRDSRTRRQIATRYILAFEDEPVEDAGEPTPDIGVGSDAEAGAPDRALAAHAEGESAAKELGAVSGTPESGRVRPAGVGPTPDPSPSRLRKTGRADSGWPESINRESNLELNPQARERAAAGAPAGATGRSTAGCEAGEAGGEGFDEDDWLDLLDALGVDPDDPPEWWARRSARAHVRGWMETHGLRFSEILDVARDSRRRFGKAPDGPKGLDRAMKRAARSRGPSPEEQAQAKRRVLETRARWIREGRLIHQISRKEAEEVIAAGLVTREEARRAGVTW